MSQEIKTITAPASKSVSHRAAICAAMAVGESKIENVLNSQDLERTMDMLSKCGATFEPIGENAFKVTGAAGLMAGGGDKPVELDVGESGTTCRLLTAVLASGNGIFQVSGRGRMHDRPIGELTDVLKEHGAVFEFINKEGYPPYILKAAGMQGGVAVISLEESSQYLSGLLLAAPVARQPLIVEIGGEKVVSWPYVGLTLQALEDFGVGFVVEEKVGDEWKEIDWRAPGAVEPGKIRFRVACSMYHAQDYRVEGDWSNASYFLAAGAIGDGPVCIKGLRRDSLQGDRAMVDILEKMGADISWDCNDVTVTPAPLKGVDIDMGASPDIVMTVATVAAFAEGETLIRNVAHLRIKESDRLEAIAMELRRVGAGMEVLEDGLRITPIADPDSLKGMDVEFCTHGDHRLAMCAAVLTRRGVNASYDDATVVRKSFPHFWDVWAQLS